MVQVLTPFQIAIGISKSISDKRFEEGGEFLILVFRDVGWLIEGEIRIAILSRFLLE